MQIIDGGLSVDDRGTVSYVNDFDFKDVKRFYMVQNHEKGFVRAWHGHKNEAKYVFVTKGAILFGTFKVDDWDDPLIHDLHRFVISANRPQIVYIPKGYVNGFKSLTEDTQVIFFSTATTEESESDDFRYPAKRWDIWEVEQR